jgi:ATP-binding cassette subfamily B protein
MSDVKRLHGDADGTRRHSPRGTRPRTRVTRHYASHARLLFSAGGWRAWAAAGCTLCAGVLTTAAILVTGATVGAATAAIPAGPDSPEAAEAFGWMIWLGLVLAATPLVTGLQQALADQVMARAVARSSALTAELANWPTGIGHLQDPQTAGRLRAMVKAIHEWTYLEGISATWEVVGIRLGGVGAFAVLASWHWWAGLVMAFGCLVSGRALTAWLLSVFNDMVLEPPPDRKRASYLFDVLQKQHAAKEIRLFGLSPWLVERYRRLWTAAMVEVWRKRNRTILPIFASTIVLGAAALVVYGQLAREAWQGDLSVTYLTSLVGASIAMMALGMLGDQQVLAAQSMATTNRLREAREEAGLPGLSFAPARQERSGASPANRAVDIVIRDLRFCYPSRTEPVFDGLDLTVPAGQSIAVVGVNGAGKSTLIKLLCGLHRPDSGEIRVGGVDPAGTPSADNQVAVIFQEFTRYHLDLRHNVAIGARDVAQDGDVVRRAVHDAGADEIVARLPQGFDTVLSSEYTGGSDLSGGQWQRIALARALAAVAGGSGVLVLDEPTAALDVRAEAELFDRFLEVTRGVTTVLVSHRLSSVRHADRIVVIDGGRIVEDGTHAELLAAGGRYATMFNLQARRFAAAGGEYSGLDAAQEQTDDPEVGR